MIVLASLALRLATIRESLWVDELHSAWVVAGDSDQIAARAALGNQTPWYFWGLWFCQQWVGDSAWGLRLPSVISPTFTALLVYGAIGRWTESWGAGMAAGLAVAVDRNAIFFGGEARGYAMVVLAMTITTIAVVHWIDTSGDGERTPGRWAGGALILGGALMAVMIHVTAALAMASLAGTLVLAAVWQRWQERGKATTGTLERFFVPLALLVLGVSIALMINAETIAEVWSRRGQWNAFARADSLANLWQMWPWTALVLLPWTLAAVFRWLEKLGILPGNEKDPSGLRWRQLSHGLLAVTIMGTCVAWIVSYYGLAAVWHRRFLIGLFPPLVMAAGVRTAGFVRRGGWLVLPLGLMFFQGTLAQLGRGQLNWVHRGEDWAGLVSYLHAQRQPQDRVWLAAQLLESRWLTEGVPAADGRRPLTAEQREYLLYPLSGPYYVAGVEPLGRLDEPQTAVDLRAALGGAVSEPGAEKTGAASHRWIVVRRSRRQVQQWWEDEVVGGWQQWNGTVEPKSFGKLTLLKVSPAGR